MRFLQAFIMFHFCHSLFSLSLHRVCVSPGLDSNDTQLWISRRSQGASLYRLLQNLQMTDAPAITESCCSRGGGGGGTYLPDPSVLVQNCRFGQADLCSQPGGLGSLSSLQSLRSQMYLFFLLFVFQKTSDPTVVACTCPIPWHTLEILHNSLSSLCSFFFQETSLVSGAYLPTGRHRKSHINHIARMARSPCPTRLPSSRAHRRRPLSLLRSPLLSHLLLSLSIHTLAFIRTGKVRAAAHTLSTKHIFKFGLASIPSTSVFVQDGKRMTQLKQ